MASELTSKTIKFAWGHASVLWNILCTCWQGKTSSWNSSPLGLQCLHHLHGYIERHNVIYVI